MFDEAPDEIPDEIPDETTDETTIHSTQSFNTIIQHNHSSMK